MATRRLIALGSTRRDDWPTLRGGKAMHAAWFMGRGYPGADSHRTRADGEGVCWAASGGIRCSKHRRAQRRAAAAQS